MIKKMATVFFIGKTVQLIKEGLEMTKGMDMVKCSGTMEPVIKVNGNLGKCREME